jgi:hypothetical protein
MVGLHAHNQNNVIYGLGPVGQRPCMYTSDDGTILHQISIHLCQRQVLNGHLQPMLAQPF